MAMDQLYTDTLKELEYVRAQRDTLAEQIKGPDGFETWRDAALNERVRRIAAENRKQAEALASFAKWAQNDLTQDGLFINFDKLIKRYHQQAEGVNDVESE